MSACGTNVLRRDANVTACDKVTLASRHWYCAGWYTYRLREREAVWASPGRRAPVRYRYRKWGCLGAASPSVEEFRTTDLAHCSSKR